MLAPFSHTPVGSASEAAYDEVIRSLRTLSLPAGQACGQNAFPSGMSQWYKRCHSPSLFSRSPIAHYPRGSRLEETATSVIRELIPQTLPSLKLPVYHNNVVGHHSPSRRQGHCAANEFTTAATTTGSSGSAATTIRRCKNAVSGTVWLRTTCPIQSSS